MLPASSAVCAPAYWASEGEGEDTPAMTIFSDTVTSIFVTKPEKGENGVRNSLVSAWVKRYLEEGEDALEPKNGNPYAALHTSKTLSEVDRLRLIIAKQEVEIARLKKGYWVEGVGAKKEYVTGSGKNTKSSKN